MIGKKTLQNQRHLFDPQRSHHSPLFEAVRKAMFYCFIAVLVTKY